jgi:hypothetical protein
MVGFYLGFKGNEAPVSKSKEGVSVSFSPILSTCSATYSLDTPHTERDEAIDSNDQDAIYQQAVNFEDGTGCRKILIKLFSYASSLTLTRKIEHISF